MTWCCPQERTDPRTGEHVGAEFAQGSRQRAFTAAWSAIGELSKPWLSRRSVAPPAWLVTSTRSPRLLRLPPIPPAAETVAPKGSDWVVPPVSTSLQIRVPCPRPGYKFHPHVDDARLDTCSTLYGSFPGWLGSCSPARRTCCCERASSTAVYRRRAEACQLRTVCGRR